MYEIEDSQTKLLHGDKKIFNSIEPFGIFDDLMVSFLSELSSQIIKSKKAQMFSDLMAFGFWCRRSNLEQIRRSYVDDGFRLGLGKVLHITPKNVPMNFAFSWALASLAGNKSFVKLPSLNFDQIDIFLEKLSEITSMGDFINPANSAIFFQTTHSSSILRQLTLDSQARIIWGNEQTVKTLKQFHTSLLHVDLIFPSRFSVSILSADEFVVLSHDKRIEIARNFVKDALTFGQRGCSSPRLIFWLGKDSSYHLARSEFWKLTSKYASKYLEPSDYFARFANLATSSIKEEKVKQLSISINEELIHFEVNHVIKGDIEEVMTLGTFQEIRVKDLVEVVNQLDRKVQTVTYFGFSPDELIEAIKVSGFSGIDRIVPLGAAFDMTSVWDGKDIIRSLSRVIEVRRRS